MKDMLARYPGTGAARLFYGFRDAPPAWTDEQLAPLGDQVLPIVSMKVWDLPAMLRLADGIPPGQLLVPSYHHEDEQQYGGDIPPDLWVSRWVELAHAFEGHPKRDRVILAPIFTRYWWEKHPGDLRYWPAEVAHLLDAVGWDVYNNAPGRYRTPDDLLRIPREMAERTGLPYFVGELGAVRVAGDSTGAGRSAWMRAMVGAAKADGALAVCWFHKDGWDLADGKSGPEQKTWQTIIREETPVATTAPDSLRAARTLLLDHLGPHGLEALAVGIVGDPAHWGGYHCGVDRVLSRDYSVVESIRDSGGLTTYASALDVGQFAFGVHDLRSFSRWVVAQCEAGAADTRDIREVIYSPDGRTVRRWDRLGRRSTGDNSHLSHTHFSFHRDATKAGRDLTPLFRRYLTTIGLIESEDTMSADDATIGFVRALNYARNPDNPAWTKEQAQYGRQVAGALRDLLRSTVDQESTSPAELTAALATLPPVDVDQLAAKVAERITAALPAGVDRMDHDQVVAAVAEGVRDAFAGGLAPAGQG